MPFDEYQGWMAFLNKRPIGWRDDYRTYAMLKSWGAKGDPWELFPSLAFMSEPSEAPIGKSILKSAFFQKILTSKGGESFLE